MKYLKRVICSFLAMCLCLTICMPSLAQENTSNDEYYINGFSAMRLISAKIKQRKEVVFESVYEQLDQQDALHMMDTYKEILGPAIEKEVMLQYDNLSRSIANIQLDQYYFPYGGITYYTSYLGTQVTTTYMDQGCSIHYVFSEGSTIPETIIETILGFIPNWGYAFSTLIGLRTSVSSSARQDMLEANYRGYILGVYDSTSMTNSSVVVGWHAYPYATISYGATNVSVRAFRVDDVHIHPEYNDGY